MTKPKILVTSAAGHTGAPAVRELLHSKALPCEPSCGGVMVVAMR